MKQMMEGVGAFIDACEIFDAPLDEARLYRGMRDVMIKTHCAHAAKEHACCGRITITAKHVTLQCPKCGDERLLL